MNSIGDTPPLPRDQLLELYRALVRTRATEERLELLLKQGHVKGGVYRSLGQEAGAVGVGYALRSRTDGTGDMLAQTIRATGALLLMGGTPLEYFRQYLARGTGPTGGKEANVHWTDFKRGFVGPVSPLGTMVGIMSGITLSFKLRKEDRVGAVFYGDGASSTGAWHEGLNFAAVQRCPMLMVVEANRWAFSTPTWKQTRANSFIEKAPGYGIAAESVDGNDVLEVYAAARRGIDRARAGEGVTLLELRTYRRMGHAQHDAQEYVDPAEITEWEERDPIKRFRERLIGWKIADASWLQEIDLEVENEIKAAAEQALSEAAPDASAALDEVYTDLTVSPPWTRSSTV